MSPEMLALIAGSTLAFLLVAKVPVGLALGVTGAMGLLFLRDFSVVTSALSRLPYTSTARALLVVIPMFVFMGTLAKHAGLAESAFRMSRHYLRNFPGGQAFAGLVGCAAFAAVSGSSLATVVSIGRLAMTEMLREGYKPAFVAGVIGAAGTLGILIPPSVVLIIYGVLTGASIGQLFIAGIIPGILSAVLYATLIFFVARRRPEFVGRPAIMTMAETAGDSPSPKRNTPMPDHVDPSVEPAAAFQGLRMELAGLTKVVLLFIVVIGGIYSGVFTTIEAATVGAFLSLVFLVTRRGLGRWGIAKSVRDALDEAISLNGMVFLLLIGAAIFTLFVGLAGYPRILSNWVLGLDVPPLLLVALILLAFIPMGMFLDPLSILLIGVPLTFPIVDGLGYNELWYGILIVKVIELGLITPPLGINAFVVAGSVDGITVEDAFRGLGPFMVVDLMAITLLFAVPALTTWLPGFVES